MMSAVRSSALRLLKTISLILASFGAITCSVALADDSCKGTKVRIVVRTIHASGTRALSPQANATSTTISLDDSIKDLQPKLAALPFSSFHLISQKEEEISIKTKESVKLPNGQTLFFRPVYMEKDRIGMWLSWKDTDGSDILNTRIHFDADESVLTGTDYKDDEGRILAIRATKLEEPAHGS